MCDTTDKVVYELIPVELVDAWNNTNGTDILGAGYHHFKNGEGFRD